MNSEVGSMETGKAEDKMGRACSFCGARLSGAWIETNGNLKFCGIQCDKSYAAGLTKPLPDPSPDKWDALRNIHGEILPEKYRFTEEDEKRLDSLDFYTHPGEIQIPPADITEADRFMAWRWYGQFMVPCSEERIGAMAWRISRERQLLSELRGMERGGEGILDLRHRIIVRFYDKHPDSHVRLDLAKILIEEFDKFVATLSVTEGEK